MKILTEEQLELVVQSLYHIDTYLNEDDTSLIMDAVSKIKDNNEELMQQAKTTKESKRRFLNHIMSRYD